MSMKKLCIFLCFLASFAVAQPLYAEEVAPDIIVSDTTVPVVTLVGDSSVSLVQGGTYSEQGATAVDDVDGDVTSAVVVTGAVDVSVVGTYTLSYSVTDAAGNSAVPVTRSVVVTAPVAPVVPSETVLIRNGASILYQGTVNLPDAGTISIPDNTGALHEVSRRSVLGFLYALDQESTAFSISDIHYYSSFGSLYLKCITGEGGAPSCDNWQYVVNGVVPQTGMDTTTLSGGESIGLYFGTTHQVVLSAASITEGGSFVATAQQYNYADNSWSPLGGVSIGVTLPNPNDPYAPTVVKTQAVDAQGAATISLDHADTYAVGIVEDYYFPTYSLAVTKAQPVSGGTIVISLPHAEFDLGRALLFLEKIQKSDGSFGGDLYTDWAAVAVSATDSGRLMQDRIRSYFKTHSALQPSVTDNERRALALLALGENPYSFEGKNYIQPILDSFDGVQFGDALLVNDDIFALIPLLSAGYTEKDVLIEKDIAFVVSKQRTDGSWEGSVDLTAAAVQALVPFKHREDVSFSLKKAADYLEHAQQSNGGFRSVYTTSWAGGAMHALGASWVKDGKSISDYFARQQAADGAVLPDTDTKENRVWATSYAIPAVIGKSWSAILHAVPKPVVAPTIVADAETVAIQDTPQTTPVAAAPKNQKTASVAAKAEISETAEVNTLPEVDPRAFTASAEKSNRPVSAGVVVSSVLGLGALAYIGRHMMVKK